MVINIIYSTLIILFGCGVAACLLFFGVKFCKDDEKLPDEVTWKDIVYQLVKGYPFWIWLLAFLVFQPAIIHVVTAWSPTIWTTCEWIPQLSDFIAFITIVFYVILINITDEYGRIKFLHKSKWNLQNLLSYLEGVF